MMTKMLGSGLLVMLLCVAVQADVYDDFNAPYSDTAWAGPSGTSPNGKWTYDYRNAGDVLVEAAGSLRFCEANGGGHVVSSTQTWDLPANAGGSLTFQMKITGGTLNGSTTPWHYIAFTGEASSFQVAAHYDFWKWAFMEKEEWGWVNTGISPPSNTGAVWDTLTVQFYNTGSELRWNIQIERPGMDTYSVDRTLYDGLGNSSVRLRMISDWGCVQYDYVDVTSVVPEPATMGLLAVGGLGALLRRKK